MLLHFEAMRGLVQVATANGPAYQHSMFIDMQILTSTFVPLTPWFEEIAIVKPDSPGAARLSGHAMRDHLFFATPPGNALLHVAQKKAGIIRDLPASWVLSFLFSFSFFLPEMPFCTLRREKLESFEISSIEFFRFFFLFFSFLAEYHLLS